jgi:hypothetical protein
MAQARGTFLDDWLAACVIAASEGPPQRPSDMTPLLTTIEL